jgi:hypothetical protein
MTKNLNIIVLFALLSFALCYVTSWGVAAVVTSVLLFGFHIWMTRHSEKEVEAINQKLKELESTVNSLKLSKSFSK